MKKQIIPIANVQTEIDLPQEIFRLGTSRVTLKPLTDDEISEVFGYRFTPQEGGSRHKVENLRNCLNSMDSALIIDLIASKHQFYLEADTESEGAGLKDRVDFAIRLVLGRKADYSAAYAEFDGDGGWWFLRSGTTTVSARKEEVISIDDALIRNLKTAIAADISTVQKLPTLRALLNAAMQQVGATDVSCALFFSLLEAMYIQDDNPSEKTYKLSMRITKLLGKDYDFTVKLRRLYAKRSKVIHGTRKGNLFDKEEHLILETLAAESLLLYLADQEQFAPDSLDRLLVG